MQGKHLFEYAVIRVVPRVEREEFLNVGVILYCPELKFLKVLYHLDKKRIGVFTNETDIFELETYLQAFGRICIGGEDGGTIGTLPLASRFRWLTATRSSVIQTSKVHPGFCNNPGETLERMFRQLVL